MHFRARSLTALPLVALLIVAAGCSSSQDSPTAPKFDTTAPTVSSTNPLSGATSVATITASFSEAMSAVSLTTTTFTLSGPGATAVTGTVTYNASNHMATFTPTSALTSGTIYTATIMTGARDMAGNPLATNYVWSFTTAAVSGTQTPPRRS